MSLDGLDESSEMAERKRSHAKSSMDPQGGLLLVLWF
jgi:hypothetical protein